VPNRSGHLTSATGQDEALAFCVATDIYIDDGEQAALVVSLRTQLNGLTLDSQSIGTTFELAHRDNPIAVTLEDAPAWPVTVGPDTKVGLRMATGATSRSAHEPPTWSSEVTVALRDSIGPYLAYAAVKDPGDAIGLQDMRRKFDRLVGIPKHEVLQDVVGRLRGESWLGEWSRRHYGCDLAFGDEIKLGSSLILLKGDPGTGKSAFVAAMGHLAAQLLRRAILFVQLNERMRGQGIQGKAASEVIGVIQSVADVANKWSMPTVIFLDEADSVVSTRGTVDFGSGAQENVAVVDAVIVGLDRVLRNEAVPIVCMMATNLIGRIDPAVVRRANVYDFRRPSDVERRTLLEIMLEEILTPAELSRLNANLGRDGFQLTAADVVQQVVTRAVRKAAVADRPVSAGDLFEFAELAVATPPVQL
jgi:ATPase family associated with various cellular activities (AAA)